MTLNFMSLVNKQVAKATTGQIPGVDSSYALMEAQLPGVDLMISRSQEWMQWKDNRCLPHTKLRFMIST
jgi:hypothetical protein